MLEGRAIFGEDCFTTVYFLLSGAVIIPGAVIGFIVGGIVMKKLKLSDDLVKLTKFLLVLNALPMLALAALFLLGCDNISLAGINTSYALDEYR